VSLIDVERDRVKDADGDLDAGDGHGGRGGLRGAHGGAGEIECEKRR
jgi:hypothetical protein